MEMSEAYLVAARSFIQAKESGIWPMTAPNPCSSYSGCQYLEACQAPAKIRNQILEGKYGKPVH
jgi:hypothetical protein